MIQQNEKFGSNQDDSQSARRPSGPIQYCKNIFRDRKNSSAHNGMYFRTGYTVPERHFLYDIGSTPCTGTKRFYPDPEKFDPERFSAEKRRQNTEGAYAPFALGPRNCIGQWYAMLELKAMLSHILRHYTIESLDPRESIVPIISITLHPSSPFRVRFRPRPARANP
ncbi:cytochrome P450 4C1 [Caerostris extrusa]|uniref:Cytochrome P450 4C1 n=1 Tax=Caerostris extrusa TaxID=172846 RepID=A0AAV4VU77_CAEEX|nr:cytochrome P450 4C1 [Caerostris extrusa]